MSRPLRVLLLEDRQDDARLILHELRQAGFEPVGDRVETEPDFLAHLDPAPDLVLADYHLPQLDALRALRLVRERGLDVPVIVVTGALGDEAAVECLKQGACDYLLKDRLARLGQAVAQALEQKQARDARRRAEQALQRAHDELEQRVRERTAKLAAANAALKAEVTERRRVEEALRQYAQRLETVQEIDRAILAARPPEEIARAALGAIRRLIPCQWAGALAFDSADNQAIVLAADANGHPALPPGTPLPAEAFGDLEDMRRGEIRLAEDILARPLSTPLSPLLRAAGVRSYLSVPLIAQDELIGCFNVGASLPAAFTPEHVDRARDVSCQLAVAIQQARLFEQVSTGRQRLRTLSRQLIMAQETERRHLARELHDEIGQSLTAISINLHALKSASGPEGRARQEEGLDIVDRTIQQVRNLSLDLRPSMLDDLGLAATLRWLVDRQVQRTGLVAHFAVESSGAPLPPDMAIAGFRVAQEALTNVVRHARVRHVWVELRQGEEEVDLAIRDDGVGFDPEAARGRAGGARASAWWGCRSEWSCWTAGSRSGRSRVRGRASASGSPWPSRRRRRAGVRRASDDRPSRRPRFSLGPIPGLFPGHPRSSPHSVPLTRA